MVRKGEPFKPWTPEEIQKLVELTKTKSYEIAAREIGRSRYSIKCKYDRLAKIGVVPIRERQDNQTLVSLRNDALITLPKRFTESKNVNANKAIVCCDPHLPYLDWTLFENMLKTAKAQKVEVCCIGGDVFDFPMFSSFPDAHKFKTDDLKETKETAIAFFGKLLEVFKKVYVISGNHDFRIFRFSQGVIRDDDMFNYLTNIEREGRVEYSTYRHMEINRSWKLVHPDSKISDFVLEGRREASRYLQSILMTHCHRLGWVKDISDKFYVVGCGCLLDPLMIAYKQLQANSYPEWNPGFVLLANGFPWVIPKEIDWDIWTKKAIV